ncbi:MAG: hypothetical protein IT330_06065, partial [Anaerolineae bacterium]|nr:hypothetical protein [Anaerolineae bacterium]
EGGRYAFTTETDDGVRFYVDGSLLIDQWRDQSWTVHTAEVNLSTGDHSLRMEYYDNTGTAVARLSWARLDGPPAPTDNWRGEYFGNPFLSGSAAVVRADNAINFDWGNDSPSTGISADRFSVRWTRTVNFAQGRYRFTTETDDGVRLYLNERLLIDQWRDQAAITHTAEIDLNAGNHSLRLEYYENTGAAVARLSWARIGGPPIPADKWQGEYFSNPWVSGPPTLVRADDSINFGWGNGAPATDVPADRFSVRWTRNVNFQQGPYRFTTETDDGVRLYIDGNLVIDRWVDMSPTPNSVEVNLTAGVHVIRMEYYENGGLASAKLTWQALSTLRVGNLITCVYPRNSWLKVYRLKADGSWEDINPNGYGPLDATGRLKIDGLLVDVGRYGTTGHPYWVELWIDGSRHSSVGNTARGEPEFRIRAGVDSRTPWACATAMSLQPSANTLRIAGNIALVEPPKTGNLVTWVRPQNSWIKVYQLQPDGSWLDVNRGGWAPIDKSGYLKVSGLSVDDELYKGEGHPYRVELWADGQLVRSVGNIFQGEPEFRIRSDADNYTPWGQNP